MKKIIFLLIIAFSFYGMNAGTKKTAQEKAQSKTTEMVTALKLNKQQESSLYNIHLKYYQSMDMYDTKDHSKKEKKKHKDDLQSMRDAEYKKILTPAQMKQYQALDKANDAKKEAEKKAKKAEKKAEKKKEKAANTPKAAPKKK